MSKHNFIKLQSKFISVTLSALLLGSSVFSAAASDIPVEDPDPVIPVVTETPVTEETAQPESTNAASSEESSQAANTEAAESHTQYYTSEIQSNNWENWPQGPQIEAQAAIVMDFNTGAILYSKEADTKLYPASITKIMTTLLACERDNMNDVVSTSEDAVYNISEDSSKTYLEVGEELTVKQLLMAVMLVSANDAAYSIADFTSGSMKKFVESMNWRAKSIGCQNTHFNNPHGLHSENHYTTAHDMALITKTAWRNPLFRSFASTITYEIPPTNKFNETRYYLNNHKMMKTEVNEYDGVLGGKTGYTDQAGNTLVTVAKRGSMTLISVVLNGVQGAYTDTAALLDYGFGNFKNAKISNIISSKALTTLPCDTYLLRNKKWPSLLQPVVNSYITVPEEVTYQQLTYSYKEVPNAPCKGEIITNCYYNNIFVGSCTSRIKKVLPELLS